MKTFQNIAQTILTYCDTETFSLAKAWKNCMICNPKITEMNGWFSNQAGELDYHSIKDPFISLQTFVTYHYTLKPRLPFNYMD